MAENTKLNDEMMENVNGGIAEELDPYVIKGIVMVNPLPDHPAYKDVWDDCQANGYSVYELTGGELAVASPDMPALNVGDKVSIRHIRGYYGWDIVGVWDGK